MSTLPLVTVADRRRRLAIRHRLTAPARTDSLSEIADSVVALHSSDPVTVYLSAVARMRDPDLAAVEDSLYETHSVVRHHAMRRTLWVMTPQVLRLAHAASNAQLQQRERRRIVGLVESSGVAPDGETWLLRARADVLAALTEMGSATARALGVQVPELAKPLHMSVGKSYAASPAAHTRVLLLLGFDGEIVRGRPLGSWISGQYTWQPMTALLPGGVGSADPESARAELVRRWLLAFGPGTSADLQWWLGGTARQVTSALAAVEAVPVRLEAGADTGWLLPDDLAQPEEVDAWVALLPGLDPTTMGWKDRGWYLDGAAPRAFDRNGNAGPTVWANGAVVGAWVQRADGRIAVRIWGELSARQRSEIDAAARRLEAVVGGARFTVRFPSPASAALYVGSPE